MSVMMNYVPDPRPVNTAARWSLVNTYNPGAPATMSVTQDALTLTGEETTGNSYATTAIDVPAGEWLLGVRSVSTDVETNPNAPLVRVWDSTSRSYVCYVTAADLGQSVLKKFTLPAASRLEILLHAPQRAASITYSHILLCQAACESHLRGEDIVWWCGDEYESGGGLPPNRIHAYPQCDLVVVA